MEEFNLDNIAQAILTDLQTNANNLIFDPDNNTLRKSWMLALCEKLFVFYDEEISKIGERKTWFNSIKTYWENK